MQRRCGKNSFGSVTDKFFPTYTAEGRKHIERNRLMNDSNRSVGYLTVTVSTARGAIPLEGATVNVRNDELDSSEILYSLLSDRDGRTPKVTLDTPPRSNSDAPGGDSAFSTYNIDVFKDGYTPLFFHNVPIFPGIHSIQPAVMVPRDPLAPYDDGRHTEQYPQSSLE